MSLVNDPSAGLPGMNGSSETVYGLPKLEDDGSNWVTYKTKALAAFGTRPGLIRHLHGFVRELDNLFYNQDEVKGQIGWLKSLDSSKPTEAEVKAFEKKFDQYTLAKNQIKHQIFCTISN